VWLQRAKDRRHGIMLDHAVDDDSRCRSCDGACCRAFPSVPLSWPEYERLQALGAIRLEYSPFGHHRLIIEHGCEFLANGRCMIYHQRPETCRRFMCVPAT
jgi:Fe-S-cluster containining protein